MGLPVPTPAQDPGPDYAENEQTCFNTIDLHDHSPGKGVPINSNGIDINADLPFNGFNATLVKTVNFDPQAMPLTGSSPNLGCVYVAGNELYYNDEAGNVVQVTNNGSVNAGAGSITGLPSGTASASYSSVSKTFIWQSATSTAANMDGGSFIFREVVPGANGVTVSSPTSLAADYQMFWPPSLPGSGNKFLTIDSSGNMGDTYDVDNSTLQVVSSVISVKTITNSQIVDNSISTGKLTRNITTFLTNGTYTAPAGVNYVRIVACGGGGGGAGGGNVVYGNSRGSGGGGGAQIFEGVLQVTPGNSYSVTIGAGGNGGASNAGPPAANGSVGGTTSFDVLLNVIGGNGGIQASGTTGGAGGSGQPGTHAGGDGQSGSSGGTTDTVPGDGYLTQRGSGNGGAGASVGAGIGGAGGGAYGAGGAGGANSPGSVAGVSAADNTGGGGGGGVGGSFGGAGGSGGSGILIVYEI